MKKTLQTLLLALVAMIVPGSAWAQASSAEALWGASAEAESFEYGTLDDAIRAARNNGDVHYIRLQNDVTSDKTLSVYGANLTLDLNGKIVQCNHHTLTLSSGELTIIDSSEEKTGKVMTTANGCVAMMAHGGTLAIHGGTYESVSQVALESSGTANVTINGGEFTTKAPICVVSVHNGGTLTINGGTFHAEDSYYAIDVQASANKLVLLGGTFLGYSSATMRYIGSKVDLTGHPNPLGITMACSVSGGFTISDDNITLPAGYALYDRDNNVLTDVKNGTLCIVGKEEGVGAVLTFNADNGTEETMEPVNITSPTGWYVLPECPFTAPEGMMFKAWLVGETEYQPGSSVLIVADTQVKAVWKVPYVVNFDPNGGTGDAMESINTLGEVCLPECPFTAPEGMMFKAWLVGEEEYQPGVVITVAADTEVKVLWTEYVPQIIIKMVDSYGDSWNGATIVVKQDGEEIGRATIADGSVAVAAFTYDNNSEYTFYWENGDYDGECSFVILVDGAQVFVAEEGSCSYSADEPFYVLVANWDAGIEQSALSIEQSAIIYDLQGRRVSEPQKGMMYIMGGKKVIF